MKLTSLRQVQWATPEHSNAVILEDSDAGIATLSPLLCAEKFQLMISQRLLTHLTPQIVWLTILYVLRTKSIKVAYAAALLRCVKPKIVLTFIDNSRLFQRLAKLLGHSIRFLAIQNGTRMLSRDNPPGSPEIFHTEFACLGQRDVDEYKNHGAHVQHFYPIGSLKDSYYRQLRPDLPVEKRFDICLISQIKPMHYQYYPKTMQSLELLTSHVKRFCDTHQTTVCVAARRHPDDRKDLFEWESEWFRERLGVHAEVIPNDVSVFTSYSLIDESRVSLAMHTTLLHEGFGRGNRILSCNYSGDPRYDFPVAGPWSLSDPSYGTFEVKLLKLLQMSDVEYTALVGQWPHYLIGYDVAEPTYCFLQHLIADAIAGAPAPYRGLKTSSNG